LVRQGDVWGASFHPELGPDTRLHAEFVRRLGHDD
ncbi:pyridoxal 5'-phosphate synthase glutaminase subunit PdxT, partial [Burkholderia multivorans]